ncbi:MAG: acetyl-CoA carboxylase biotin carboxyl carrier protein subunit [Alphaproteobacteria bacterium]|nr:acetyl-CoA carboxylase biotin carboxyl carrier protein subunit [Alphaproteobacteria bacterium]MBT4018994.1 acetyl-CoA carboxylase biotin carboxyl carrier protein subunit [Alphaproteobacteria bacterium]MBT4965618.1 acetyl-CoA carboxylase biotin carboxyl carrier protein subunit [Alphaproteobacteria bacterium]MBT5159488.1 acetyl-CoA carboxylase biotin carboxyl carrier protein subunit [Alphaproteobacteria bacterium]MBT5917604.1 acetyl-CoA carboxylase biotin carboxyl carrier protein subunit [Alph
MAAIEVRSEVAGNVWLVEASPDTNLEEDDVIVVLESMKMEIPVTAPSKGKLTQILVSKDDMIAEDQVIALMEI